MSAARHVVVIFAHPNPSISKAQKALYKAIHSMAGVEIRDLYQLYPDFYINVKAEQEALRKADLIIFQHPIYWYSTPALLKEWQDAVLEQGFAYGPGGVALKGKDFLQVISSGGLESAYHRQGSNRFLLPELLRPFEATAWLCGLHYHKPFAIQGIASISEQQLAREAEKYRLMLQNYLEQGRASLQILDTTHQGFAP